MENSRWTNEVDDGFYCHCSHACTLAVNLSDLNIINFEK